MSVLHLQSSNVVCCHSGGHHSYSLDAVAAVVVTCSEKQKQGPEKIS